MPGKVPTTKPEASFGSTAYPIRKAMCPACNVLVPVTVAAAGALKGKLTTTPHSACQAGPTRVVLPHEVVWPAAA